MQAIAQLINNGLLYVPFHDTYTYRKSRLDGIENETEKLQFKTFRPFNCSKVDHVLFSSSNTAFKSVKVSTDPSSLIFSDHKIVIASIELYEEDSFIAGKCSRWKVRKLIPEYKSTSKDGKQIKEDINDASREHYQHTAWLQWCKRQPCIYWYKLALFNFELENKERQNALDQILNEICNCINVSMTQNIGTTKPQPAILQEELRDIYKDQKVGNKDLALLKIEEMKREGIKHWKDTLASKPSHEVDKIITCYSKGSEDQMVVLTLIKLKNVKKNGKKDGMRLTKLTDLKL